MNGFRSVGINEHFYGSFIGNMVDKTPKTPKYKRVEKEEINPYNNKEKNTKKMLTEW